MSIFSKIKDSIFGKAEASEPSTPRPTPIAQAEPSAAPPAVNPVPLPETAKSTAEPTSASASKASTAPVDVIASLEATAKSKGSDLNWRTSIVDLMKLLDIDSSLSNRKELAQELQYPGAADGSAEMNIWLHKAVMRELAKNGGKVPAELTD